MVVLKLILDLTSQLEGLTFCSRVGCAVPSLSSETPRKASAPKAENDALCGEALSGGLERRVDEMGMREFVIPLAMGSPGQRSRTRYDE